MVALRRGCTPVVRLKGDVVKGIHDILSAVELHAFVGGGEQAFAPTALDVASPNTHSPMPGSTFAAWAKALRTKLEGRFASHGLGDYCVKQITRSLVYSRRPDTSVALTVDDALEMSPDSNGYLSTLAHIVFDSMSEAQRVKAKVTKPLES